MLQRPVRGRTRYNGYLAQQHYDVFDIFSPFLEKVRPSRILEIGTAGGGFTLYLKDTLNKLGLVDSTLRTYERRDSTNYDFLVEAHIEVCIKNLFDHSYRHFNNEECLKEAKNFIQKPGPTLVLCDGGSKANEFRLLAPLLKVGDIIMGHDYIPNMDIFESKYKGKIWNWPELRDEHVDEVSNIHNLRPYNQEEFSKVAWLCKKKY